MSYTLLIQDRAAVFSYQEQFKKDNLITFNGLVLLTTVSSTSLPTFFVRIQMHMEIISFLQ